MGDVSLGTVYDINKAVYSNQSEKMPETLVQPMLEKVSNWFKTKALCEAQYYMFLCRDRNDYTIFNFIKNNPEKGIKELIELIQSRGILKDIVYNEKYNYYEFWISIDTEGFRPEEYMYILFPCNEFVIEIGD